MNICDITHIEKCNLRWPKRLLLTAVLLKCSENILVLSCVFINCLLISKHMLVSLIHLVFMADQQPIRTAICCCSQAMALMPTAAIITMRLSVTARRKPGGRMPAKVCFPQGWPLWSSAVSRRTPCCSGSLGGKLWQPGVNKNRIICCSDMKYFPSSYNIRSTLTWMKYSANRWCSIFSQNMKLDSRTRTSTAAGRQSTRDVLFRGVLLYLLHREYHNLHSTSKLRTFFWEMRTCKLVLTTSNDWLRIKTWFYSWG